MGSALFFKRKENFNTIFIILKQYKFSFLENVNYVYIYRERKYKHIGENKKIYQTI